ncbi:hypothetical protein RUND412_004669 [Rhizina undulata]
MTPHKIPMVPQPTTYRERNPPRPFKEEFSHLLTTQTAFDAYQFDVVITRYKEFLQNLPYYYSRAQVFFNLGQCYILLSSFLDARRCFSRALEHDAFCVASHVQLGVVEHGLKRYQAALQAFDGAVKAMRGQSFVDYEQLGLKYKTRLQDVLRSRDVCRMACEAVERGEVNVQAGMVSGVPAMNIFRIDKRMQVAAGKDVLNTAEWRFRKGGNIFIGLEEDGLQVKNRKN